MPTTNYPDGLTSWGIPVLPGSIQPYANVHFVNGNASSSGGDGSRDAPYQTMAAAFSMVQSGDVIFFKGNIREQLSTPVGIFDVTIIGCGNRPRHADAHTGNNGYSSATWKSPASPTAATPLLTVLQQGWSFKNFLFSAPSDAAAVQLFRDGGAGDAERDASHAAFDSMRFDGGQDHIEVKGGPAFIYLVNSYLRGATATSVKNTTGAGIGTNLGFQFFNNVWQDNVNHIVVPMNQGALIGNTFGKFTTMSIDLQNGTGNNVISRNTLSGTYSIVGGYRKANANDEWGGNFNGLTGGVTADDPA